MVLDGEGNSFRLDQYNQCAVRGYDVSVSQCLGASGDLGRPTSCQLDERESFAPRESNSLLHTLGVPCPR